VIVYTQVLEPGSDTLDPAGWHTWRDCQDEGHGAALAAEQAFRKGNYLTPGYCESVVVHVYCYTDADPKHKNGAPRTVRSYKAVLEYTDGQSHLHATGNCGE